VLQPHPPVRTAERAERLLDDPSSDPWGPGAEMTVRVRREPEARRRLPQAEHPVAVIPHLEAGTSGVGALRGVRGLPEAGMLVIDGAHVILERGGGELQALLRAAQHGHAV